MPVDSTWVSTCACKAIPAGSTSTSTLWVSPAGAIDERAALISNGGIGAAFLLSNRCTASRGTASLSGAA
eukprot:50660-Eustigmatos_ZCMA.PRE.1